MKQKRNYTVASLIGAATQVSAGAELHAASLGLVVATKPLVDAEKKKVVDGVTEYEAARKEYRTLRNTLDQRRKESYDLAFIIRDSLKRFLGREYSSSWEGTSFRNSLKIPESSRGLQLLLLNFKDLLAKNPSYEIPQVVTSAIAGAALDALVAAETAVMLKAVAMKTALAKRRRAERVLRLRIRGVVEELNRVIGPVDVRWEAFGLNQPGVKQAPPAPEELSLSVEAEDRKLTWEPAARADYYRVWLKVANVHEEPVVVATRSDTDFSFEEWAHDAELTVWVSAVNAGGESSLSAPLVIPARSAATDAAS